MHIRSPFSHSYMGAAALSLVAAFAVMPAHADPLQLSYTLTNNGSNNVVTGAGTTTGLTVPGTYTYGHSYNTSLTNSIVDPSTGQPYVYSYLDSQGNPATTTFNFYDDFVFTVAPASANSITSTIDFGNVLNISNLQVRLYNAANQSSLPVVRNPASGAIDAWSTTANYGPLNGTVSVLPTTNLLAGTYVLEVRGNVTGSAGGSYSGVLNVAPPVPVPAAIWMFGSAVAGLFASRRRNV